MNKIKELFYEYPIFKKFGIAGIILMVLIFVLKTIAGVEIENRWNNIVHHENGAGSSIICLLYTSRCV